jgi:hypothetical protein
MESIRQSFCRYQEILLFKFCAMGGEESGEYLPFPVNQNNSSAQLNSYGCLFA